MKYLVLYKYGYWKDEQEPYEYGLNGIDPRPVVDGSKIIGSTTACMTDLEHWFHGFGPDECKEEPNYSNASHNQVASRKIIVTRVGNQYLLEFECFFMPHWLNYNTWRSCKVETIDRALSGTHRILCPPSDAAPQEYPALLGEGGVDVYCHEKPVRTSGSIHDLIHTPSSSLHAIWRSHQNTYSAISHTALTDQLLDQFQCLDFEAGL